MSLSIESSLLMRASLKVLPTSWAFHKGVEYGLADTGAEERLAVLGSQIPAKFTGDRSELEGKTLLLGPLSPENAAALRSQLPWLQPQLLGLRTSAGLGDRIGLATPGHVRAIKAVGGKIAPIFPQQSIREMARTERTPVQVMDDALWGVFREGWQRGFGADADHLKTFQDIETCFTAGYSFFTIDPGDHVDNRAESAGLNELIALAGALPAELTSESGAYLSRVYDLEGRILRFTEETLYRSMVKYGRAVLFVASMNRHLEKLAGSRPFELEVSVDETEQPTTHAEHIYIASELKRLGVRWVSLAPRYVGRFEKGVDYIGSVSDFEADLAGHAAIARIMGPYKLSIHSGSDKYSIYPAAMRQTGGLVHLKTAGTSYLEALHTVAMLDVPFFREIYEFSRSHYETDRATYHLSAELNRAPLPDTVRDWPGLLHQFDAREILHATFGSVLTQRNRDGSYTFKDRLVGLINANRETYAQNLERHFIKHLTPFVASENRMNND